MPSTSRKGAAFRLLHHLLDRTVEGPGRPPWGPGRPHHVPEVPGERWAGGCDVLVVGSERVSGRVTKRRIHPVRSPERVLADVVRIHLVKQEQASVEVL